MQWPLGVPKKKRPAVRKEKPLHQQVIDNLRDMIIEDELPAGSRIPERKLCEMFGISRTPLREALKVLESEKFVELIPNRGAIVSQPKSDIADDKFELLSVIETTAARWACKRATPAEIDALVELHKKMVRYFELQDVAQYFRANQQFHQAIVSASRNLSLQDIHKDLLTHLKRSRYRSLMALRASLRRQFVDDHGEILEAIRTRNAPRAERAFAKHNERVLAMVDGTLDREEDGAPKPAPQPARRRGANLDNGKQADNPGRSRLRSAHH